MRYQAFISYKHTADGRLFAESLENALKKYAKPFFKKPPGIFRDEKIMLPGSELSEEIIKALAISASFIYVASRAAAAPGYVSDEIRLWLADPKRKKKFMIVNIEPGGITRTGKGLEARIDWEQSASLPSFLSEYGLTNPLVEDLSWVTQNKEGELSLENLNFRSTVNALSAGMRDIEPGAMTDEATRQYRRNRRIRNGAITVIAGLLIISLMLLGISMYQTRVAIHNKASALASLSATLRSTDPTLATRVAQAAWKLDPEDSGVVGALQAAFYDAPFYDAFGGHMGPIHDLYISKTGNWMVTAGEDHAVVLRDRSGKPVKWLSGHKDVVYHLAVSPHERFIASADARHIIFWDSSGNYIRTFDQGDLIYTLQFSPVDDSLLVLGARNKAAVIIHVDGTSQVLPHKAKVASATFSPDGQEILTACDDSAAHVWNLAGRELRAFPKVDGNLTAAVFSPDGKYILTAGFDKKARLWTPQGKLLKTFDDARNLVSIVGFSPSGDRFFFVSWDRRLQLYALDGFKKLATLDKHTGEIESAVFSPDGRYLATAGRDGRIFIWDSTGGFITELKGHVGVVHQVAFTGDGNIVVSGGNDNLLRTWNWKTGYHWQSAAHHAQVMFLAISRDGLRMATGDNKGQVIVWDNRQQIQHRYHVHHRLAYVGRFSPDGNYLATGGMDSVAVLYDLSDTGKTYVLQNGGDVRSVGFSRDSRRLVTASYDSTARVWDMGGRLLHPLRGHHGRVFTAAFTPRDQIVTLSGDQTAIIWDTAGSVRQKIDLPESPTGIDFHPDGNRYLLTWREGAQVMIRRFDNDSILKLPCPEGQFFYQAIFSPDGHFIAGATSENQVIVWSEKGDSVATLTGHVSYIDFMAFSHDSHSLLTASADNSVRLWDLQGRQLQAFQGHRSAVKQALFNASDDEVISVSYDSTIRFWPLDPARIIRRLEEDSVYQLTTADRRKFGIE